MKRQSAFQPAVSRSVVDDAARSLGHALDGLLNQVFALTHDAALRRSMVIFISFILIWLVLSFTAHPAEEYSRMVNETVAVAEGGDPQALLLKILGVFAAIFLNMAVVRHLLVLYVPFWLMQRVAAIFLADIFEKDEKIALAFIRQAAFAATYNSIHIRQGKVVEEDRISPIVQFGGPGYIVVELDSAVVLEKPDGSARVIGPGANGAGSALIEGFERIRQGIDLRDVIEKQEVTTRSRDGIPVTARDIQYSYSLYRGPKPVKSPQTPYPYDDSAVLNLVYGNVRSVKLAESSELKHDWLEPLPGKIFGQVGAEMGNFINRRGLSDFLAAVGRPEDESLQERRKETDDRIRGISEPDDQPLDQTVRASERPVTPDGQKQGDSQGAAAEFVPRTVLTTMFYDNFQARAAQRGTQLNWVGVGTWDTPTQIIPKYHREAWKISRENFARGNTAALQHIYDDARLQEMVGLIEDVSIRGVYTEHENQVTDEQVIISVLKEHLAVFERARDLYRRDNIPVEILIAIQEIERWLFPPSYPVGQEE